MGQGETSQRQSGGRAGGPTVIAIKWLAIIVLLGPVLGTLIHEVAHLVMLWATGAVVNQVVVLGTLQLWPAPAIVESTGAGFMLNTTNPDDFSRGLVWVSGASSTFLVALAAVPVWLRTRSGLSLIFVGYMLDLLTYLALPSLGLKRWVFFGAPFSEVLAGLSLLGVGRDAVAAFLLCFILAMLALFASAAWRRGRRERTAPARPAPSPARAR
jgi:hypothetical protein